MIDLPPVERRQYPKTFLSRVILQIQFPPILAVVAEFHRLQERLRPQYPIMGPPRGVHLAVSETGIQQHARTLILSDQDGASFLEFLHDRVTLVFERDYPGWETAFDRFQDVVAQLWEEFEPHSVRRVGLRYQDVVERLDVHSPEIWKDYVRPELLTLTTAPEFSDGILGSAHNITIAHGDAVANFKWRTLTGKSDDERPAQRLELDFEMHADNLVEDLNAAAARFEEYHDVLIRLFEWVITPKWREELEGD